MVADAPAAHRHAVLLVEDDHDTREAFTMLAVMVGLDVVAVENGRVTLQRLRNGFRPCLIVLDMAMPEHGRVRISPATSGRRGTRQLVRGGHVRGGVQADARKLGLAVFLRKPIEPQELLRAFSDHCGAQRTD